MKVTIQSEGLTISKTYDIDSLVMRKYAASGTVLIYCCDINKQDIPIVEINNTDWTKLLEGMIVR